MPVAVDNIAHVEYDRRQETGEAANVDSSGGFLTTSLSAAALNQSSCAVPMRPPSGHAMRGMSTVSPPNSAWQPPPADSAHFHQEQCPHYHADYKFEADTPS